MKKAALLTFLSLPILFLSCGGEDEPSVAETTDISGEYQGRLTLSNGDQGIVLYRFESMGNNTYRGYYEGIEFGEVTVTQTQVTGEPTNGNQSFATLIGSVSDTGISFALSDTQGNAVGAFGGTKVSESEKESADLEISGKEYVFKDDFCAFGPGGFGITNEYERLGGVEKNVFFSLTFESEPATGTYNVTLGIPSSSSFSGDITYLGDILEALNGSATVTNSSSGLAISMDNVTFETSTSGAVTVTGSLTCSD